MTLSIPTGFEYVEVIGGADPSNSRGYTVTNSSGGVTRIGEDSDISKYVQCYFFNEESGQLTIKLRDECVLKEETRAYRADLGIMAYEYESNKSVIDPIDAVLNRLAMKTFMMPANGGSETFSLLDGSKTNPRIFHVPGLVWFKMYYDKERTKLIDFASINHTAFDKRSYELGDNGNEFRMTLKNAYKNHAGVLYALHDVLERICGIARRFDR